MQQLHNDRSASGPDTHSSSPPSSSSPSTLPLAASASASASASDADADSTSPSEPRQLQHQLQYQLQQHSTSVPTTSPIVATPDLFPVPRPFEAPNSPQPVSQWKGGLSQNTLASPVSAFSTSAIHHASLQSAGSPRPTPSPNHELQRPPISAKRYTSLAKGDFAMQPSPVKKARTGASPPRKVEIPAPAKNLHPAAAARALRDGPQSPLFFSHTPSRRVSRPQPPPPLDDLAASMLTRMREDPAGSVTTLKLPRASVSAIQQSRTESTPGSMGSSMDMPAHSGSPDSRTLSPSLQMLQDVGVIEFLEQDERPTFLVDLETPNGSHHGLHISYCNIALRAAPEILQQLTPDREDGSPDSHFSRFKTWVTRLQRSKSNNISDANQATHAYAGVTWSFTTMRNRFRFVSGYASFEPLRPTMPTQVGSGIASDELPATPDAELLDAPDYFGDVNEFELGMTDAKPLQTEEEARLHPDEFTNQVFQAQPARSIFDWTRIPLTDSLPTHIKFARSIDWGSTPLGPMEDWPSDLRSMSNLVMGSPHPAAMYWGPEFVCIYNEAYLDMAGQKHPKLMGAVYREAWSEIWDEIKPVFESALESGQATMKNENQLFINRHGFLEESFFSWSIVPLVGGDGEVAGLYNPAFENTRRRVNERRMLTLREIGERTATATSVGGFWPQVQKGLEYNENDVPFALIYSVKDEAESEVSSLHSGSHVHAQTLCIEGSLGVPEGHPAALTSLDLRTSDEGFAPYMRQSMAAGGVPVVLSEEAGNLPLHLIEGLHWRGFKDPCRTLVIFPVTPTTTTEAVYGFIVMGTNPRRLYDDDYKLFVHLLSRQLATSMASAVLFEEEIKRGQKAARLAALDRQELSMQLYLRTQEAVESEYRFSRMAEFAPVGMFIANHLGQINYCNDMWWQISRHSRSEDSVYTWLESVRDEDRPRLQTAWNRLVQEKVTISVEFRFKCSQRNGDKTIDTWVLMSAYPEKTQEGNLKSIFGCITDISTQKWAEKVQTERREEAVELKRQQENFIDITSHEMRNPLSAILQCADQIANNISTFSSHDNRSEVEELLDGCLDAANTINLCASHQKRIVDDILTLSKLDSNLLAVTPVDDQPVRVVQRALKMFESELMAHDIEFDFCVDDTFERYGVKWTRLDPSRLRQVLINLMTNAIKFTQGREKRSITVSLSASKDVKEMLPKGIKYFDRVDYQRTAVMDINNSAEWGDGEEINIHCTVEDTGPGLLEEEVRLLFQRFQQATPRTHVQYGGSGLGLFISRILTEMQGGQIGVSSTRGVGSQFNFYVKTRRCLHPPAEFEHISPFKIARKSASPATPTKPHLTRQMSKSSAQNSSQLFDVLIVEDNIVNQKVLQRQLRNCGNNTFVANHGKEALQTLQQSRFWAGKESEGVDISVILMDLEMPVMDGMTCARKIRELEREGTIVKHIPIIAVTAYARPEQIANAKAAGIDDVISKPFRIPELIPKIEELVGKYKNLSVSAET